VLAVDDLAACATRDRAGEPAALGIAAAPFLAIASIQGY
jgi:hypothetical protein